MGYTIDYDGDNHAELASFLTLFRGRDFIIGVTFHDEISVYDSATEYTEAAGADHNGDYRLVSADRYSGLVELHKMGADMELVLPISPLVVAAGDIEHVHFY